MKRISGSERLINVVRSLDFYSRRKTLDDYILLYNFFHVLQQTQCMVYILEKPKTTRTKFTLFYKY